jgi:hypothetical protein
MATSLLQQAVKGRQKKPYRILIYGPPGLGKSTFAASAKKPFVIATEDGVDRLDVASYRPKTWPEVLRLLTELESEKHDYETVVLDSMDWADTMLQKWMLEKDKKGSLMDYGYGDGYKQLANHWANAIEKFNALYEKGMHVIFVGHAQKKMSKNPHIDDFERFEPQMDARGAAKIIQWCCTVLFANYEIKAIEDEKTGRVKGVATDRRLIYGVEQGPFTAKNRDGIRKPIPLPLVGGWDAFVAAATVGRAQVTVEEVFAEAEKLPAESVENAKKAAAAAKNDQQKLFEVYEKIKAKQQTQTQA